MDYKILTIFKIFIHKKDQDLDLLCQVKIYFRLGKITKHAETIQYRVKYIKDLYYLAYISAFNLFIFKIFLEFILN